MSTSDPAPEHRADHVETASAGAEPPTPSSGSVKDRRGLACLADLRSAVLANLATRDRP